MRLRERRDRKNDRPALKLALALCTVPPIETPSVTRELSHKTTFVSSWFKNRVVWAVARVSLWALRGVDA